MTRPDGSSHGRSAASVVSLSGSIPVTASARHGYELAALVVILYWGVHFAGSRGFYYDWDRRYLYGAFDWYLSPHQFFPLANLLFVAGAILLLPYLAQLSFARRDL